MKKLTICILIISNIYFIFEYKKSDVKYDKLVNKHKSEMYYTLYNSVNEMNTYFDRPDILPIMLNAEAGVYFKLIGENNDPILTQLNAEKYACRSWTKNTKKQYENLFLKHMKVNDFNSTHETLLKGLTVTDLICLPKKFNSSHGLLDNPY